MLERTLRNSRSNHELSVAEMVLIATAEAANWTTNPVPYGEIVVRAWGQFPEQFGLPNHPEFPDSSDVHKRLYGPLKSGEWVESLGNKTFRITNLGLTKARSILGNVWDPVPLRPILRLEVQDEATTQWTMTAILDAAGSNVGGVAEGLLTAIFSLRFPASAGTQSFEVPELGEATVIGDYEFKILIPTTLELLQEWLRSDSKGFQRRLLVRDSVVSDVQTILRDSEYSTVWATGLESFIAQVVDGMAAYEKQRTVELLEAVTKQYNQNLKASMPYLCLEIVGRIP